MAHPDRASAAMVGASIGAMTGLISYGLTFGTKALGQTGSAIVLNGLGLVFAAGAVLCVAQVRSGDTADPVRRVSGVAAIAVGWYLALNASIRIYSPMDRLVRSEALQKALAMNVGNLIGVALTLVGLAIAAKAPIGITSWLGAIVAGGIIAAASAFLRFDPSNSDVNMLLLLPAWQAAVLAFAYASLAR